MRTRSILVVAAGLSAALGAAAPAARVAHAPERTGMARGASAPVAAPVLHAPASAVGPASPTDRTRSGAGPGAPAATATSVRCYGAEALLAGPVCAITRSGRLTPSPAAAAGDKGAAYTGGRGADCFARQPAFALRICRFGDRTARTRVALVGNSHAGQWLPALLVAARRHHWRIVTFVASQCAFADTAQRFLTAAGSRGCRAWVRAVESRIDRGGFRLVVLENRLSVPALGHTTLRGSYRAYLRGETAVLAALHRSHRRVYAIRDTPAPGKPIPACLAAHPGHYLACAGTPARWLPPDPVLRAAAAIGDPRIHAADLTGYLCSTTLCPAAIGGVIVYRDGSHQTATYNRTIGPYLAARLERFLTS